MPVRAICLFALIVAIAGCAPRVTSQVTRFHAIDIGTLHGSFAVVPEGEQRQSLEFRSYAREVARQLTRHFLVEADNPAEAKYIVKFEYGHDGGKTTQESRPVYGQTGNTVVQRDGQVYTEPTYGYVGTETASVTTFTRQVQIDIFTKKADGVLDKIHETRVVSVGASPSMATVVPYMIQAAFSSFPGIDGSTETITLQIQPQ